ncbi:hypothetical protein BNJ_00188 [Kaumoebavirus]|uniref:hypothetical protein n=1 Tax=Kaumoebavirus TaxID=1859492 RepID=UPI0009C2220A|nr:hypothetical protein BNJ_00188 [Kaumoebavirus]ARA72019.1 hypothetical protein BNJ_00188 [Kaumoebavirus]
MGMLGFTKHFYLKYDILDEVEIITTGTPQIHLHIQGNSITGQIVEIGDKKLVNFFTPPSRFPHDPVIFPLCMAPHIVYITANCDQEFEVVIRGRRDKILQEICRLESWQAAVPIWQPYQSRKFIKKHPKLVEEGYTNLWGFDRGVCGKIYHVSYDL